MAEKKEKMTETNKRTFRTAKNKNFSGFVHPGTRKFIAVDSKGELNIDETDTQAIVILERAADLIEV